MSMTAMSHWNSTYGSSRSANWDSRKTRAQSIGGARTPLILIHRGNVSGDVKAGHISTCWHGSSSKIKRFNKIKHASPTSLTCVEV